MIRCVAFDLDGVVIPSDPSFELFEREHGITREQFRDFFSGDYVDAMAGQRDLFDVLPKAIADWGWNGDVESFANAWFSSCDFADPEAARVVGELRDLGLLCCAASNQDHRRAAHLEQAHEISSLFQRQFFSCQLGAMKPHPDYFRAVEALLDLQSEEILFVDDKPANVAGAKRCGWRAEHVAHPSMLRAVVSRHVDLEVPRPRDDD